MKIKKCNLILILSVLIIIFGFSCNIALAAKQVYYSVGQNISDHKTGSPTVTISGAAADYRTATFSVAQTVANMGVGDRITYNGSTIAYISGKISQLQWTVVTKLGVAPSNVTNATVNSIRHEFSSLSNAISYYDGYQVGDDNHLNTMDLVSGNYVLNIPCYYDSGPEIVTDSPILLEGAMGFTTSATNYIRIYTPFNISTEVNQSQRHDGKWNSQRYNIRFTPVTTDTAAIRIYISYIKIDGLQINVISNYNNNSGIETSYAGSNSLTEISNNIIKGQISTFGNGIYMGFDVASPVIKVWNNIIYDMAGGEGSSKGIGLTGGTTYFYNNTILNSEVNVAIWEVGTAKVINNISQDCNQSCFSGTFVSSSDYNISSDGTAPGTHSKKNATVSFVDKAGKNFHLNVSDTIAKDAPGLDVSTDPNLSFGTDIDNEIRPYGSSWDIGADEYFVPPAPTVNLKAGGSDGPISITKNTSTTLSWTLGGGPATSCNSSSTPASSWSGSKSTSGGSQSSSNLTATTTFNILCTGPGGSISDRVEVRILGVSLSANPNSGIAPMSNVSLTASVTDDSSGTYRYFFDCNNDGVDEATTTDIAASSYTAANLCSYYSAGNYIAKVSVWHSQGSAVGTTSITISPPPPDFSVSSDNNVILVTLLRSSAFPKRSTAATIRVTPQNGFSDNVTLSIKSVDPSISVTPNFSINPLTSSDYSNGIGSSFSVDVPSNTPVGTYDIIVTGIDGGTSRDTNVIQLNVEEFNFDWQEF